MNEADHNVLTGRVKKIKNGNNKTKRTESVSTPDKDPEHGRGGEKAKTRRKKNDPNGMTDSGGCAQGTMQPAIAQHLRPL